MQERLWLTEPRRATCLATVTDAGGGWFVPDRCLFAPRSRACRHPQNPDTGHIIVGGEKRHVVGVVEQDGRVWLRLRGAAPKLGDGLQCQLDQEVRLLASRAHTGMHLLLHALAAKRAPALVADPEVKGGGHFRLELAGPVAPTALAAALATANSVAASDAQVQRSFDTRDVVRLTCAAQPFDPPDPFPCGDVAPVIRIGEVAYPCDGTHVERTGKVGRLVIKEARASRGGMTLVGKVTERAA